MNPTAELIQKYSEIAVVVACIATLFALTRNGIYKTYLSTAALLVIQAGTSLVQVAILFYRKALGVEIHAAYHILFYSYWFYMAASVVLRILIIYSVFRMAMKPLQGLHQIGKIIFRWVAAVSIMISAAMAAGPHVVSPGFEGTVAFTSVVAQSQQAISVLTICLLLFVCFSIKPLGLTFRSRIFGVCLGLGMMATASLVQSAWSTLSAARSVYSPIYIFAALGTFSSIAVWGIYFAVPEPERRLILLPTTSPFFFWNRISEALGDAPGHVAIAGFRPDMLAAAEMQMLSAPALEAIAEPVRNYSRPAPLLRPAVNG